MLSQQGCNRVDRFSFYCHIAKNIVAVGPGRESRSAKPAYAIGMAQPVSVMQRLVYVPESKLQRFVRFFDLRPGFGITVDLKHPTYRQTVPAYDITDKMTCLGKDKGRGIESSSAVR